MCKDDTRRSRRGRGTLGTLEPWNLEWYLPGYSSSRIRPQHVDMKPPWPPTPKPSLLPHLGNKCVRPRIVRERKERSLLSAHHIGAPAICCPQHVSCPFMSFRRDWKEKRLQGFILHHPYQLKAPCVLVSQSYCQRYPGHLITSLGPDINVPYPISTTKAASWLFHCQSIALSKPILFFEPCSLLHSYIYCVFASTSFARSCRFRNPQV